MKTVVCAILLTCFWLNAADRRYDRWVVNGQTYNMKPLWDWFERHQRFGSDPIVGPRPHTNWVSCSVQAWEKRADGIIGASPQFGGYVLAKNVEFIQSKQLIHGFAMRAGYVKLSGYTNTFTVLDFGKPIGPYKPPQVIR
jgi:hypothetical protein